MDHRPSHPAHDIDPHADTLTSTYGEIDPWVFLDAGEKAFTPTFTSFYGVGVSQQHEATLLPGCSGLNLVTPSLGPSMPSCGGLYVARLLTGCSSPSPYLSSKAVEAVTPEPTNVSLFDPALLSPFTASSRATPGTGPTIVRDLPSMNYHTGSHRGTPGPSRSHSSMRLAPELADTPALEGLLVRAQGSPCPSTPVIRPPRDAVEK